MSILVKNIGDFFKLLIQTFNLSSTLPALAFVILVQQYIYPILPWDSDTVTLESTGVTVAFVALIAYLLDAANLQIIRLFEGYMFANQFPLNWFRKRNQKHVRETLARIRQLERLVDELIEQGRREKRTSLLDLAEQVLLRKRQLVRQVAHKYPEDPNLVLPSPFGNVIAAAEYYPKKTFGMEAVVLWPFLVPTLTQNDYAQFVMRAKAMVDFLVNLTVVLVCFGCLLGFVELRISGWSEALMIKLGVIALSCVATFTLAVQGAFSWGATIRTAFVIFREDLHQTLHLREARNFEDEREIWKTASNFFRAVGSADEQRQWGRSIFDVSSHEDTGSKRERQRRGLLTFLMSLVRCCSGSVGGISKN